jgi:hypothetical protein
VHRGRMRVRNGIQAKIRAMIAMVTMRAVKLSDM